MMHRSQSCRTGMTLTELLVVVAILLMLTVATLPRLRPTDTQKCREAALTLQSMASRVARRAEENGFRSNGTRSAGLWLEPLNPLLTGTDRSLGALQLFACEPQDPYRGDAPESARVYVHHPVDDDDHALLLFSSNTAPNVREFARSASRIRIGSDAETYYLRVLTDTEQNDFASQPRLLPRPYSPTPAEHPLQRGYYVTKPLTGAGEVYRPFGGAGPAIMNAGDVFLAYVAPASSSGSRPKQSLPQFNAGQPPGALYDDVNPCNPSPPAPDGGDCDCIESTIENDIHICVGQPVALPSNFPASEVGFSFQIDRPITRSASPPLALPAGYGIDVFWSSYGEYQLASRKSMGLEEGDVPIPGIRNLDPVTGLPTGLPVMAGFHGLLSSYPIMVMLNPSGGVASLVFHRRINFGRDLSMNANHYRFEGIVEDRFRQVADVYLLVGRLDRAGRNFIDKHFSDLDDNDPGANWQYPDSRWVRISKTTGEVLIAEPILGQKTNTRNGGTWPRTVLDSQRNARLGIAASRN